MTGTHRALALIIEVVMQAVLQKALAFLPLAAVAFLCGCSERSESRESTGAEIRGQPISASTPTTNVPARTSNTVASSTVSGASEYTPIGFDKLSSYPFELSDDLLAPVTNTVASTEKIESQIPRRVKDLDRKRIGLTGFMLPLKVEKGLVTELLIMKDQSMCCYGVQPKINEWVSVKMVSNGVKAVMDQPVTLFGKLHVGEMRENGYLVGIYAMDGEKMQVTD